ncbi:hypothetical protein F4781DRAFT_411715 [Annulohypoxylon bovei var. microspora]|nr:hypothetical protein F4781DRAFT_411715 [Annulohypoxylon bovei var. microspora]
MHIRKTPDDLESPSFEVHTANDAEKILEVIHEFNYYVFDIEAGVIQSPATQNTLHAALDWIKYAITEFEGARSKLGGALDTQLVIREALEVLNFMWGEIEQILTESDQQKEKECKCNYNELE